jgi:hypothetical protein
VLVVLVLVVVLVVDSVSGRGGSGLVDGCGGGEARESGKVVESYWQKNW